MEDLLDLLRNFHEGLNIFLGVLQLQDFLGLRLAVVVDLLLELNGLNGG